MLRDFYAHANLKVNAVAFVLKTILGVVRPLREGQTLTLETAEPANLDGEMIAGRPDQVMLLRRGPTVEFIRDLA